MEDAAFRRLVWEYHGHYRRSFEWREQPEPYRVFISEVMLQQTQTGRVAERFPVFLTRFPDFPALADASLGEVLAAWQGLGYNRRARFLHEASRTIAGDWGGVLPADEASMRSLPGIGPNTAASILAFAFNVPTVFIETNIRTVFLHHYHPEAGVPDKALLALVARTLDHGRPREWYYALMDYGVHLKREHGNANRRSPHYSRQSRFEGSVRQVRGAILKAMVPPSGTGGVDMSADLLLEAVSTRMGEASPGVVAPGDERFAAALAGLVADGLVAERDGCYGLPR
jgi:A/G-specific adenine glycosylase